MSLLVALLACSGGPTTDTGDGLDQSACTDAPEVTWDGWTHGFFLTYCTACHSANNTDNRAGAPESVNFDSEADVRDQADRVRARVIEDLDMPVGGGVYDDDLYLLDLYLRCQLGA
jgi:uncharacterized membrane protein